MMARWETAFVGVSALLGEPLDAVAESLGHRRARAADVLRSLRSSDRSVRARAMAAAVAEVATEIEMARLA
jgi:hypothetical protein